MLSGVLAIGGCDKNMPGAMIAIARMNIPSIFVYGGTIKPGHYDGRDLDSVERVRKLSGNSRRSVSVRLNYLRLSEAPVPEAAGSCGGMFTANTMSSGD